MKSGVEFEKKLIWLKKSDVIIEIEKSLIDMISFFFGKFFCLKLCMLDF